MCNGKGANGTRLPVLRVPRRPARLDRSKCDRETEWAKTRMPALGR